jgi:hypothetical protein
VKPAAAGFPRSLAGTIKFDRDGVLLAPNSEQNIRSVGRLFPVATDGVSIRGASVRRHGKVENLG